MISPLGLMLICLLTFKQEAFQNFQTLAWQAVFVNSAETAWQATIQL
jgi:hypothetical protein